MGNKSVKLNFIMNIILTMSSFVFPIITFPYVSRVLLPSGMGKVTFAISFIYYFTIIAQLGIPIYGIRATAKVRDNKEELTKTVQEIFIINIIISILVYLVFIVMLFKVQKLSDDKLLFIVVSITIVFNTLGLEWLYKGLELYTYIAVRSMIVKIISIIAMFVFVHKQGDYVIYAGITVFANVGSNVLNLLNITKHINFNVGSNLNFIRHLKAISIFFAMTIAGTIYTNLDTIMLGFIKSYEAVGFYNAAVKIKTILVGLVTSLGAVLLPRASYYIENGLIDRFYYISKKALNFVLVVSVPLTVYFMLYAKQGILILSGPAYSGSILSMQIIMPTILFIGLTNIMGIQMLIPLGKEKAVLISQIIGAIINIIINLILIPKISSAGTAIGTLSAEFIVFIIQLMALKSHIGEMYGGIKYRSIFMAILSSSAVAVFIKYINLSDFMTIVISSIFFFFTYLATLIALKEPLTLEISEQILNKIYKTNF